MISNSFIHDGGQLQINVTLLNLREKNKKRFARWDCWLVNRYFVRSGVWRHVNVTSAIWHDDVLRSSFKWNPRCITGAPGGLACVEGRQADWSANKRFKVGGGGWMEKGWGSYRDLLDESMKRRKNEGGWWEMVWGTWGRVVKEGWSSQGIWRGLGGLKSELPASFQCPQ